MEQFEYKILSTDAKGFLGGKVDNDTFNNELNKLGMQGWELVNTVAMAQSYGSTRWLTSIFKRKINKWLTTGVQYIWACCWIVLIHGSYEKGIEDFL